MKVAAFRDGLKGVCTLAWMVTMVALSGGGANAVAAPTNCPEFHVGGIAPDLLGENLRSRTAELCFSEFGTVHSGISAGPLWVAQHLTGRAVREAKKVPRVDKFYPETQLPASERAELEHYRKSGYDRGHMAPAADMASHLAQDQSFSLANMVPQAPSVNRELWASIEATTRALATSYGEIYVVSGPAFLGERLKRLGGRVLVPTNTFKAVYIPSARAAAAWWVNNVDGSTYEVISLEELKRRTGVSVFPAVDRSIAAQAAVLPTPRQNAENKGNRRAVPKDDTLNIDLKDAAIHAIGKGIQKLLK